VDEKMTNFPRKPFHDALIGYSPKIVVVVCMIVFCDFFPPSYNSACRHQPEEPSHHRTAFGFLLNRTSDVPSRALPICGILFEHIVVWGIYKKPTK